ncbi:MULTISPECIES: hypothetical protein [Streptomyces]|uniref:hypothetical protein n=1 Tax=Streptomyces TaxID=1883 RepID=UPI002F951608
MTAPGPRPRTPVRPLRHPGPRAPAPGCAPGAEPDADALTASRTADRHDEPDPP